MGQGTLHGSGKRRGAALRAALAFLVVGAGACAAGCALRSVPTWPDAPSVELQWPHRPAPARIRWIKTIASEHDAGIVRSFWQRALDLLAGTAGSRIVRPHGVLFDAHDRLFIADPGAGVVHCMDLGAGRYVQIGAEDGARLQTPIGLTVDDRERLYITDSATGTVYRYDLAARTLQPFLKSGLERPTGIVWSPTKGLLYVVDTLAHQVVAFDEYGAERFRIGGTGEGEAHFNHPTDICTDARGQLYVTDALNAKIKVLTPEGRFLRQFGIAGDAPGEFNKPKGVATDSEGHIYVSDALLDAIQIFDPEGRPLLTFGANGTGDGEFWMPSGLFIDRSDRIFVADTYNRRVQVFRYLPAAPDAAPVDARPR